MGSGDCLGSKKPSLLEPPKMGLSAYQLCRDFGFLSLYNRPNSFSCFPMQAEARVARLDLVNSDVVVNVGAFGVAHGPTLRVHVPK